MKLTSLFICLLALLVLVCSVAGEGIESSYDDSQFRCWEDIVGTEGGTWTIEIISGGAVIGFSTQTVNSEGGGQTNFVSADISQIPCGQAITCKSTIQGQSIQETINKTSYSCETPDTLPGTNISTGNQSIPGVNYGTIPFNSTGDITSTKILGLDKTIFFTLAGLVILTLIATTIRNLRLGLVSVFLALIFMVDVLKILTFPTTLLGLALIIVIAYVVKGVKL